MNKTMILRLFNNLSTEHLIKDALTTKFLNLNENLIESTLTNLRNVESFI